ncbi:MAG: hypothetical protein HC927_03425 [Deltaproteobacteria bacterium]|nr:hypothetical protein [Deltaproteobacteria bacterium]
MLTLDNYVRGSARIHVGMAREQQRKHKTAHELDQVYARIFEQVATTERYPMIARALAAGMFTPSDPPRDEFEFGLARVLDGIEARVRGLAGVAGPT